MDCHLFLGKWLQPAQKYGILRGIMFGTREDVCYTCTTVIMLKVIVWMSLFPCTGSTKPSPLKTAQSTHFTAPDSTSLCPRSPQMRIIKSLKSVLLWHKIKRRSLTVRASENICSGKGYQHKLQRRKFTQWNFSVLC